MHYDFQDANQWILANKLHKDLKLSRHVPLFVEFAVQVFEKVDDYFRNHTIKLNRRAY